MQVIHNVPIAYGKDGTNYLNLYQQIKSHFKNGNSFMLATIVNYIGNGMKVGGLVNATLTIDDYSRKGTLTLPQKVNLIAQSVFASLQLEDLVRIYKGIVDKESFFTVKTGAKLTNCIRDITSKYVKYRDNPSDLGYRDAIELVSDFLGIIALTPNDILQMALSDKKIIQLKTASTIFNLVGYVFMGYDIVSWGKKRVLT
jgi:hypothetical protein